MRLWSRRISIARINSGSNTHGIARKEEGKARRRRRTTRMEKGKKAPVGGSRQGVRRGGNGETGAILV